MALFEFVTVIISMILALSIGQLLQGAASLVKNRLRVTNYLPHVFWMVSLFTLPLSLWWSQWDFRDLAWTFPSFCYVVLGPTILYFATSLIVPEDAGGRSVDLEEHFFSIRPVFLTMVLAYLLITWFDGPLLQGQSVFGPVGLVNTFAVTLVVGGLFTESRPYHLLSSAAVASTFPIMLIVRFLPGALG